MMLVCTFTKTAVDLSPSTDLYIPNVYNV